MMSTLSTEAQWLGITQKCLILKRFRIFKFPFYLSVYFFSCMFTFLAVCLHFCQLFVYIFELFVYILSAICLHLHLFVYICLFLFLARVPTLKMNVPRFARNVVK